MIPATRKEALRALSDFLPQSADYYSKYRNFDKGPANRKNVSLLSASLQRRILTEKEVIQSVLQKFSFEAAEKFIQEVLWRSYWKDWLELRPSVWESYCKEKEKPCESGIYDLALNGKTGIQCFDFWRKELQETGYLHNHTRMWFASIWIFTLNLPWEKGARLFENELLDFDSASNTLSWRWVAGLQTSGKHYLARAENIEKFTEGRFNPIDQLNEQAQAPAAVALPIEKELRPLSPFKFPEGKWTLLIHDEDYSLDQTEAVHWPLSQVFLLSPFRKTKRKKGASVIEYEKKTFKDLEDRTRSIFQCPIQIIEEVSEINSEQVISVKPWIGHLKSEIEAIEITSNWRMIQREYDSLFSGKARSGFFSFKQKNQALIDRLKDQSSVGLELFYETTRT